MDGGSWNRELQCVDEVRMHELCDRLPIICMFPEHKSSMGPETKSSFHAPVYKTLERRGVCTRNSHSTNFVMFINLKSRQLPRHWIERGTAIVCQLNE